MATPEEPITPTPVPPTTAADSGQDAELRAFIIELMKQTQLGYTPGTFRKATVVSHESTATPPTCTVQFPKADGTAGESIAGVRYFDHYTPVAGDTVILLKQGTDIVAIGEINDATQGGTTQGWATISEGGVEYRKVVDNGDFKIQLKGSRTGLTGGQTTITTLPTGFRPTVTRTILCGRSGDLAACKVQITTGGVVSIVDGTNAQNTDSTTPAATGSTTPGSTGSFDYGVITDNSHTHDIPNTQHSHTGTTFVVSGHEHGIPNTAHTHGGTLGTAVTIDVGSHSHSSDAHTHTSAAHTHTVTGVLPGTVHFDGKEFFL